MKTACGSAHMKSILAIGELGTMENVYKVNEYINLNIISGDPRN